MIENTRPRFIQELLLEWAEQSDQKDRLIASLQAELRDLGLLHNRNVALSKFPKASEEECGK